MSRVCSKAVGSEGVTLVMLLLVVIKQTDDGRDSDNGSQEPEGEVALAVGVDVDDGTAVEGVVSVCTRRRPAVKRLGLFVSAGGGSVVGHDGG